MRWIVRLAGALAVFAGLCFAALAVIPSDQVARLAVDRFNAATGRKLVIEGAVTPSLWPVLGVATGRVSLSNAAWSDNGPMLVAEGLAISLDAGSLLKGDLRITGIALTRPDLLLERSADGVPNWEFGGGNGGMAGAEMAGAEMAGAEMAGAETVGADGPFTLDLATVTGGRLRYIDAVAGQNVTVDAVEATLMLPAYDGPLVYSVTAIAGGQPVAVEGNLGAFATAYGGGVVPVAFAADIGAARLTFEGRGGLQPLAAEGRIAADLGDMAAVAAVMGVEAPALPDGFGADRVGLEGQVTRSAAGDWYLRDGTVTLDDMLLTGDVDLAMGGARPRLTGRLATRALHLGQGGTESTGSTGGAAVQGWSEAPLSAEGLHSLDADLVLAVQDMRMGAAQLGAVAPRITVDAGRAVVDLGRVAAYGGTLSGQVVVNARKGLSVGGKLALGGVALQPLLRDVAGYDRLTGTGDLQLDFVGAGGSVAAIMRSLDGQARLALGPGELRGIDVPAMLATLDAGQYGPQEKTVFDGLTASAQIADGDMTSTDLALQSAFVRVRGDGRIGLGARDIDFRLRAMALQGADGVERITVPIRITGAWAAPQIALDLGAIAQERLGAQAKAAEDELRRRAAEELGQQSGESLEDAARRRVQDEVDAQAGKLLEQLLGGN